jgi:predicted nucleic-acid-binding protein
MRIASDTNVLVRILVQDPTAPDPCAAARRWVADATAAAEPLLMRLCALLDAEWVLRSCCEVGREAMVSAFIAMLESPGIGFEHDAAVAATLYLLDTFPGAAFADGLFAALAAQLGRARFVAFDAGAACLPCGEFLQ